MDAEHLYFGVICIAVCAFIAFTLKLIRDFVLDALDTMSKLAQIVSIHQKSKTAAEAVEQTLTLDANLRALDRAEKAADEADAKKKEPQRPRAVGFKDPSGKIIHCSPEVMEKVAMKLPKERLVYE